jgi:hypothetical protein
VRWGRNGRARLISHPLSVRTNFSSLTTTSYESEGRSSNLSGVPHLKVPNSAHFRHDEIQHDYLRLQSFRFSMASRPFSASPHISQAACSNILCKLRRMSAVVVNERDTISQLVHFPAHTELWNRENRVLWVFNARWKPIPFATSETVPRSQPTNSALESAPWYIVRAAKSENDNFGSGAY